MKVGDRVIVKKGYDLAKKGAKGIVVVIDPCDSIGVQFDVPESFYHTCNGMCPSMYGYYVNMSYLKVIPEDHSAEPDKKTGITKFEEGKYYIFHGGKTRLWSDLGGMDFMLDRKPHLCIDAGKHRGKNQQATFQDDGTEWSWDQLDKFEEVKSIIPKFKISLPSVSNLGKKEKPGDNCNVNLSSVKDRRMSVLNKINTMY